MQVGKKKLPGTGLFRTFIKSDKAQPAIIAINNKNLLIRLNDSVVFSQNSFWSGDQQVNVELQPGLNVIEIHLRKGRRAAKAMPPVFLYDPVGQALKGATYLRNLDALRTTTAEYDQFITDRGNVVHIQAVAGLQFAPKEFSVTAESKVRLVFSNPDIMMHNWVLLKPGTVDEIGALADQLASQPHAMAKGYLPESDKILQASKLLGPNGEEELVFTAPSKPGNYPYICTFPGHWRIMQGTLTVTEKKVTKRPSRKKTIKRPAGKKIAQFSSEEKTAEHPTVKSATIPIGEEVLFETNSSPDFETLIPKKSQYKITANQKTNNDPLATLSDGKLSDGYGPVFPNGVKNGAYKMDLGTSEAVTAITSWSHKTRGRRGAQSITIFGSNSATDPGWDISDKSLFTPLGTISTKGQKLQDYTALSKRAPKGKSLGTFRWIIWQNAPVTKAQENTAFQEFHVETAQLPSRRKTKFKGFDYYKFRINNNQTSIKIIAPKKAAPSKPWLWRSLFWETVDQVNETDLKLVEEGYHIVLVHGDIAGHPEGNANIDAAYDYLTKEHGFAKTCSMSSISRGTLSLFRWATENPEKVNSIYVDNGVCNVLSWPAGKIVPGNDSIGKGSPDSWAYFKKKFGYKTDAEALKTKESPIYLLEPLAKHKVPILLVCGNKDLVVPYEENDAILEKRYKDLGGPIEVIIEDKGHTHGMKDPTPILKFIREHSK